MGNRKGNDVITLHWSDDRIKLEFDKGIKCCCWKEDVLGIVNRFWTIDCMLIRMKERCCGWFDGGFNNTIE